MAACAEVSVSDAGDLKIHRIVAATDPGYAVNPQQIEAQIEGSFVFGLSALLYGDGLFETMRVFRGQVFRWEQHLARLRESADRIALPLPWTDAELAAAGRGRGGRGQ